MSTLTIGFLGFALLMVLIFLRMPITVAMGSIGVIGMAYLSGFDAGINLLKTVPYATVANYGFSVVPLFILMGNFCFNAGVSKDLYHTVRFLAGPAPGRTRNGDSRCLCGFCGSERLKSRNRCHYGHGSPARDEGVQI